MPGNTGIPGLYSNMGILRQDVRGQDGCYSHNHYLYSYYVQHDVHNHRYNHNYSHNRNGSYHYGNVQIQH